MKVANVATAPGATKQLKDLLPARLFAGTYTDGRGQEGAALFVVYGDDVRILHQDAPRKTLGTPYGWLKDAVVERMGEQSLPADSDQVQVKLPTDDVDLPAGPESLGD